MCELSICAAAECPLWQSTPEVDARFVAVRQPMSFPQHVCPFLQPIPHSPSLSLSSVPCQFIGHVKNLMSKHLTWPQKIMTAFRFHLATTEIAFYLCFFAINTIFINLCSGLKALRHRN